MPARSRDTVQLPEQHPHIGNHTLIDRAGQAPELTKVHNAGEIAEPFTSTVKEPPVIHSGSCNGASHDVESVTSTGRERGALTQLKEYLSPTNITSASPILYKPHTIRSLYLSAKHRTQLHELGAEGMSSLISLFGTLSISASGHPYRSIFMHPLAIPIMGQTTSRSYWPFIVQLARDKEAIFQRLDVSDHYWLMRAKLAELEGINAEELGQGTYAYLY